MQKNKIESVFTVEDFRESKTYEITVSGSGQNVIRHVKNSVSRYSKIVLDGFNINDRFVPLSLKTHNVIK